MRKLVRSEAPICLQENAEKWTSDYLAKRETNPAAKFEWHSKPCYGATKKALLEMTKTHCAFCDGRVGAESRETVEHFRPKSKFPALAYVWSNLFPCCDQCQSQKREYFDELLIKPDEPGYRFEDYFIPNFKTGEIAPRPDAPPHVQDAAEVTIKLYGLNLAARSIGRLRELSHFERDPEPNLDEYNYRYFLESA